MGGCKDDGVGGGSGWSLLLFAFWHFLRFFLVRVPWAPLSSEYMHAASLVGRTYQVPRTSYYDVLWVLTCQFVVSTRMFLFICFFFLFPSPFTYLRSSFSRSLLVVTQIRGHIAGSSPPLPATVRDLPFYREKISALASLVDSRRIVPTHAARRSQQLIP